MESKALALAAPKAKALDSNKKKAENQHIY
jgi:hypothetical protein